MMGKEWAYILRRFSDTRDPCRSGFLSRVDESRILQFSMAVSPTCCVKCSMGGVSRSFFGSCSTFAVSVRLVILDSFVEGLPLHSLRRLTASNLLTLNKEKAYTGKVMFPFFVVCESPLDNLRVNQQNSWFSRYTTGEE